MAADDAGERSEQPTARRLQEARDEGRIARSQDLIAAFALVGGLLLLRLLGSGLFESLLRSAQALGETPDVSGHSLGAWCARVGSATLRALVPFLALLMVVTGIGAVVQSGLPISFKRLRPRLDKLNPINGVKRLFSLDSLTRVGMGILKMAIIGLVAYLTIVGDIDSLLSAGTLTPHGAFNLSGALLFKTALRMGLVILLLALLDYCYQRWNWWRNLKMTKQEVKDEMKRMEGDPQVRSRRRQLQFQLALQRIGVNVPRSDVVVTNPTEFAVALRYQPDTMSAPRVTAKGQDLLAQRIQQIARQHGVPVVQRPPLARTLYAAVDVGREVPPTFYRAVAEVLAYVYQISRRTSASAARSY